MCVGVLDDGLKDHRWNDGVVEMRINRHLLLYSSGEAAVLHGQVHLYELHLVAQGDELRVSPLERDTQEATQLFQHKIRGLNVASHEARDAVHRVEKKVRIELHTERPHLRLDELGLQL